MTVRQLTALMYAILDASGRYDEAGIALVKRVECMLDDLAVMQYRMDDPNASLVEALNNIAAAVRENTKALTGQKGYANPDRKLTQAEKERAMLEEYGL